MPRPLRPFAGRWSLVAAVLLPQSGPESPPRPSNIHHGSPPSPQPSLDDDEPLAPES